MRRAYLIVMFVLMGVVAGVPAGEGGAELPEEILVRASLASPLALSGKISDAVEAVTGGTGYATPPGMVATILQMQIPIPPHLWLQDRQLDVVITSDPRDLGVVIRPEGGLDTLLGQLDEYGGGYEEEDGVVFGTWPGLGPTYMADAGDEKVLMAGDRLVIDTLAPILREWHPAIQDGVDIVIEGNIMPGQLMDILNPSVVHSYISRLESDLEGNADEAIRPVIDAFFTALQQSVWNLNQEIATLSSYSVSIRLDEYLRGDILVGSKTGMMAALGQRVSSLPLFESPMLSYPDTDALALTYSSPYSEIYAEVAEPLYSPFISVIDELGPEFAGFYQEAAAVFDGRCVVAEYPGRIKCSVTWMEAQEPAVFVSSMPKLFDDFNAMLNRMINVPGLWVGVKYEVKKSADGIEYLVASLDSSHREDFIRGFEKENRQQFPIRDLLDCKWMVTAQDGLLVMVAGSVTEEDLARAVSRINDHDQSLFDDPMVSNAIETLRFNRAFAGVVNIPALMESVFRQVLLADGRDTSTMSEWLETGDGVLTIGMGGEDGKIGMSGSLPLSWIRALLINFERMQMLESAQGSYDNDDGDNGEDEDEDDDEEYEFDGPIEAS